LNQCRISKEISNERPGIELREGQVVGSRVPQSHRRPTAKSSDRWPGPELPVGSNLNNKDLLCRDSIEGNLHEDRIPIEKASNVYS
jgi:hypothetical protein